MTTVSEPSSTPQARSSVPSSAHPAPLSPSEAIEAWHELARRIAILLRDTRPDIAWVSNMELAKQRMSALARRDPDTALYLLIQAAASENDLYSAQHAMLCALVCELCATWFEWSADEVDVLVRSALTMNLAMTTTQDTLARQIAPLTTVQRDEIDEHAETSATLLAEADVADTLWLEVVRQHHKAIPSDAGQTLSAAQRLAQLLHRVDIYTAKLSRRAVREATTPSIAARDACLDASGLPDPIGATILRVLGLYPPGSLVLLASGEIGVVIQRGAKAHTPIVALLRRADGGVYVRPLRKDTAAPPYTVVRGMSSTEVKMRLLHERVLNAS